MKNIKRTILSLALLLGLVLPVAATVPVNAQVDADDVTAACSGLSGQEGGNACTGESQGRLDGIIKFAVDTLSWIVGIASVIMIIIAGFKFITSGGNASNITSARQTLIYAIIGVAVVAAAQILVNFVVNETS